MFIVCVYLFLVIKFLDIDVDVIIDVVFKFFILVVLEKDEVDELVDLFGGFGVVKGKIC